ncbi:MAG: shikimate dehydrogenase [Bacteroidales bacterium]|jgi:shikimate dehydrogenase|nr:shikimate dehydrogenase [Bacteroidales bacterium]
MRFFGLIGKKLEHSFSPVFFKEKFEEEGIEDAFYNLYPLKNIDELNQLITDFSNLSGLNVTIPYKQDVISFLDEIDEDAKAIGAINTIKFDWIKSKLKLTGYNTDYLGFIDSIKPLLKKHHKSALVLGTGGGSLAIAYALKKLGIIYTKVSRNPKNNNELSYELLNKELISETKLIINTTPLGMYPDISQKPDIPYDSLTKEHLLYDLIYNPKQTEFLRKGEKQGAVIKNGFEMLIKQAEYSWKIWNNYPF